MNQEKIGKFIANLRKENKMTQKDLANKLNITDKAISKWENGRCMPDFSLFEPLSKILNITVSDLLNGERIDKKVAIATTEKLLIETVDYSNKKVKKMKKKFFLIITTLIFVICFSMFNNDYDSISKGENPNFMFKIIDNDVKSIYIGPGYKMIKYKNSEKSVKFGFWIFSWNISVFDPTPSPLTVINKNDRVLTEIGSYCIKDSDNGIIANICGDAIDLTEFNYKQLLDASVDDIIITNDDSIMISEVTFYDIDSKKPLEIKIDYERYSFIVPNIKGTYYVKLNTFNEKGNCWYSFKINIK